MFSSHSRGAESEADPTSPMSFFISNLYTITETEVRSVSSFHSLSQRLSVENISEDRSSNRSSGLTALPRWEGVISHTRPRLHVPLPVIPRRAHVRKDSEAPILEKDELTKEFGDVERSDSRRSERNKSRASTPAKDKRPRYSRTTIWLLSMLLIFLILIVILGAVLGTLSKSRHPALEPSVTQIPAGTTPTPTTSTGATGTPVPTPHLASVSATGWSVPGSQGYDSIWLFWQNSHGYLSRAAYNSSTGNWTRVSNFVQAKENTPIAASALDAQWYEGQENYNFPGVEYQTSVVYLDEKDHLNEWIFPDNGPEIGQPGPLSQQQYTAHDQTKIGAYWPHFIYQGPSGEIRAAHYACHEKNECWHETVLRTTEARNGTQLVTLPATNNVSTLEVFYQEEGGRLLVYKENSDGDGELWDNAAFSQRIPPNASVAAFSTTRSNKAGDENLNTYLLWQDEQGTIHMSWTDDDDGWKGPLTYPAFAGAEQKTALTCLTGLSFPTHPLQSGTELARCYFLTGLALREVSFDGDSWSILGVVPIDF